MSVNFDYDMNRCGLPADDASAAYILATHPFCVATRDVQDLQKDPLDNDPAYRAFELVQLQRLFGQCKPAAGTAHTLTSAAGFGGLTTCLHTNKMTVVLDEVIQLGLLANGRTFASMGKLIKEVGRIITQNPDNAAFFCQASDFDVFEAAAGTPGELAWLEEVSVGDLVKHGTLEPFVEFKAMLGNHATAASRLVAGTMLQTMGAAPSGIIFSNMQTFFGVHIDEPAYFYERMADFFQLTQWPETYDMPPNTCKGLAFELPQRVAWPSAKREDEVALVLPKLPAAVARLPYLAKLLEGCSDAQTMAVELGKVGDAVLGGADSLKRPLHSLPEIHAFLAANLDALIDNRKTPPTKDSSRALLDEVVEAASKVKQGKGKEGEATQASEGQGRLGIAAPSGFSIVKATYADPDYQGLAHKWLPKLLAGLVTTSAEVGDLIGDILASESTLGKAVLFYSKEGKPSRWVEASDFLRAIADSSVRDGFALYLGQSLCIDDKTDQVPETLGTVFLSQEGVHMLTSFQWQFLVASVFEVQLKIAWSKSGNKQRHADISKLWRNFEAATNVSKLMEKLFGAIGYGRPVPKGKGLSWLDFYDLVSDFRAFAQGQTEAVGALIQESADAYLSSGLREAAKNYANIVYGSFPGTRSVLAFIPEDSPTLLNLKNALAQHGKAGGFKQGAAELFADTGSAQPLFGLPVAGSATAGGSSSAPVAATGTAGKRSLVDVSGMLAGSPAKASATGGRDPTVACCCCGGGVLDAPHAGSSTAASGAAPRAGVVAPVHRQTSRRPLHAGNEGEARGGPARRFRLLPPGAAPRPGDARLLQAARERRRPGAHR
jgi:hypothetical protein